LVGGRLSNKSGTVFIIVSEAKLTVSLDESFAVMSLDPQLLRSLGLISVLDRLSGGKKVRRESLTPDEAKGPSGADANCSIIIYDIGGASLADHKHQKRIKALRLSAAEAPLVILSDNDSPEEIVAALNVGAQGFLSAGMDVQLALQALTFIAKGGSYFPAVRPDGHPARPPGATDGPSPSAEQAVEDNGAMKDAGSAESNFADLTERQRTVLERVSRGDSNKIIARVLGIKEGTVKFHVRQLMRKLGVANRTQIAIARTNGAATEMRERPSLRGR
jgi:DNA-binding NarL/FixJ family response regulator